MIFFFQRYTEIPCIACRSSRILLSNWEASHDGILTFWQYLNTVGLPIDISAIVVLADTDKSSYFYTKVIR